MVKSINKKQMKQLKWNQYDLYIFYSVYMEIGW